MPEKPRIDQGGQAGNDLYAGGAILNYFPDPWAATPFVSAGDTGLFAGFDPVVDKVSTPNFGGVVPEYKTASGAAPLHIADAVKGQIYSLLTNILPQQDLHGYASPWPAGGGKNKFDSSLFNTDTSTTIVYTTYDVGNGTYTMSSPDYPIVANTANVFFIAGSVTSGASSDINGVTSSNSRTITVSDGHYTVAYRTRSTSNPNRVEEYNWQIESGSSATTWTPYANICPIGGWTGCNVYISPTTTPADATVYPCVWQDEAGTVYGGRIDIASGWMEVTHITKTFDGTEAYFPSYWGSMYVVQLNNEHYNGALKCSIADPVNTLAGPRDGKCYAEYNALNNRTSVGFGFAFAYATPADFAAVVADLYSAGTPVQVTLSLGSPQYYQVPAVNIFTLDGNNYIWTDCGNEITASYVAAK